MNPSKCLERVEARLSGDWKTCRQISLESGLTMTEVSSRLGTLRKLGRADYKTVDARLQDEIRSWRVRFRLWRKRDKA